MLSPLSRKIVRFKAELISGEASYRGFIENLSADDIFVLTTPSMTETDSVPGTSFKLIFTPFSGETLNLSCRIKWSYKTPPLGTTNIIAQIVEPLLKYNNFFKTLQ